MKTLPIAIAFGLFGAGAVSISFFLMWPTWVMFIAWVSFYVFGKTWMSSIRAFAYITSGIFMGISIQLTGGYLSGFIGALAFPLSVFVYIGSLAYFARTKSLNNLPAWFLGLIVLFGVRPPMQPVAILEIFIPLIGGLFFAWLNDLAVKKNTRFTTS